MRRVCADCYRGGEHSHAPHVFTWVQDAEPDPPPICECEQDWRCPLHEGMPTWLESRFTDDVYDGYPQGDYP